MWIPASAGQDAGDTCVLTMSPDPSLPKFQANSYRFDETVSFQTSCKMQELWLA